MNWRRVKARSAFRRPGETAGLRSVRIIVAAIALLATVAPEVSAADQRETVAMAFSCAFAGNQVHIVASDEQLFPIIGKREAQTLRVCSGPLGARCRDLQIFRFRFDCAGKPIDWVDAAAAAVRGQPWKATLIDARMTLHYWPDGPSVDRRLPLTLPAGFAPAPASGLRFSSPLATDNSASGGGGPAKVSSMRFERPPAHATEDAAFASRSSPRPTEIVNVGGAGGHEAASSAAADPGWSATAIIAAPGHHGAWWRYFVPAVMPNGWLTGIGIAALLLSATAVAARQHVGHRASGGGMAAFDGPPPEPARHGGAQSVPPPPAATHKPEVHDPKIRDEQGPVAELASALLGEPLPNEIDVGDWSSVSELRTSAEALLNLVGEIVAQQVPDGAVRDVLVADLAVIAARLDSDELANALSSGRLATAQAIYEQAIIDLERARTLSRIEHERAIQVIGEERRSPGTVEEACAFLGVNPRAGEAVVKKVVDALRQNWHPDLARDEIDRDTREERIKHINAAWDLIRRQ